MFIRIVRILAWVIFFAILAVTVSPINDRPHVGSDPTFERAGAYALLGLLFCIGYRRYWPVALLLVLLAAVGFEFAQMLTSDRHARLADALVKATGGVLGVGVGLLWKRPSKDGQG